MRIWRLLASLSVLLLGVVACSDGGGDGDTDAGDDPKEVELTDAEQEYADAFAATLADDTNGLAVEPDEAACMGAAVMAELGVDPFEEADVTADDVGGGEETNSPGEVLGDGVISEAQANAIIDVWVDGCVDLSQALAESAGLGFGLDEAGQTCFAEGLAEDDLARKLIRPSFTSADGAPDPAAAAAATQLVDSCSAGEGSAIVDAMAESIAADSDLTAEQAQCIAQEMLDDIGLERLAELSADGTLDDADPEVQQEIAGAVLKASGTCDVPLSALGG